MLLLPAPKVTIILHGWHWVSSWGEVADSPDPENPIQHQQHASEMPSVEPDGWCVYTRHADPSDPSYYPFDLSFEQDFETYEEAQAEAQLRADAYGIEYFED